MATIDPSQFKAVHKFFPQLTRTQSADAFMFSKGVPTAIIAELRDISEDSVKDSLKTVRKKLGVTSAHAMITAVDMSVALEVLAVLEHVNACFEEVIAMRKELEKMNEYLSKIK